ncbi:T9SS type A sorting domain-containing protein [bacterium]|nr:T9SS type A sorting domain-containing protein [bacterium]
MRRNLFIGLSLLLCIIGVSVANSRSPLSAGNMNFVCQGRTYAGQNTFETGAYASEDFNFFISCHFDTGGVDVGFVIDSSGSMSGTLTAVKATIGSFATGLDTAGYDARYGGCPYADSTRGMWDFNASTPHPDYEMTNNISTFQTRLATCGASGGGDTPEEYLDALAAVMRHYDWRLLSMKIIIGFTDAVFCELGNSCFDCRSNENKDDILDELIDGGFILFNITKIPPYWSSCVPASPYHSDWYQLSADTTGGQWYNLTTTPWTTIFSDVITFIRDYQSIGVAVINSGTDTIYDVTGELIASDCFEVITAPAVNPAIAPGDTVIFNWRLEPFDPVTCPMDSSEEFCFLTVFHATDGVAPISDFVTGGCVFFGADCGCDGTNAEKEFPPNLAITSCPDQLVRYSMSTKCYLDTTSFIFKVNSGSGWIMIPWNGDGMTMLSDTGFVWAPAESLLFFEHGDTTLHELYQLNDVSGLGLHSRPSGNFVVDLLPPVYDTPYPVDGALIGGPPAYVRINVTDDLSGVDPGEGWWLSVNDTEVPTTDSHLTFDGMMISLEVAGSITSMFPPGDTIEICVGAQDSPDLCDPNVSSICWSFIIDYLDFDLPEMIVEPNDTFLVPIIAYNPNRFVLHDFSVSFEYNPDILIFTGTDRTGSALPTSWITSVDTAAGVATVWGSGTGALADVDTLIFLSAIVKPEAPSASFTPLIYTEDGIVLDSGYIGYRIIDNGWVLVGWSPETWVHDLTFDSDTRPLNTILTFGMQNAASASYDLGIDIPFYPPPANRTNSYFPISDSVYPLVTKLERDLRAPAPLPVEWKIATVGEAGILTWSTAGLPEGELTLNGMIEMHLHDTYHYAANETITIVYDRPEPIINEISIDVGWNLVGFPCIPTVDVVPNIIPGGLYHLYGYNPFDLAYFSTNRAEAGHGYWVYSMEEGTYNMGGIPVASYEVPLNTGWNLVGCANVSSATYTSTPAISGLPQFYNTTTGMYETSSFIEAGMGYWILVTSPGTFQVPGARSFKANNPDWSANFEFDEKIYTIGQGSSENSLGIPPITPDGETVIPGALMMDGFKMWSLISPDAETWTFHSDESGWLLWNGTDNPRIAVTIHGKKTVLENGMQLFLSKGDFAVFNKAGSLPEVYGVMVKPNPANAAFMVTVDVPQQSDVTVGLYDMLGKRIDRIADEKLTAGTHSFNWHSKSEPSGVYFVRVNWDGGEVVQKVVLLK